MHAFRRIAKPVCQLVAGGVLALSLHLPTAHAALVPTEALVAAPERAQVAATLARADVRAALLARGVDPAQVQARLDALTDQETQALAAQIDELPAGGDALGLVVLVFLVLLFTDIMGFTDIFPFVKKTAR
jgi:hypothetical protein